MSYMHTHTNGHSFTLGCHYSSMDSSAPSILPPWFRVPSTPSMVSSLIAKFLLHLSLHCEKNEKVNKRRPGLTHSCTILSAFYLPTFLPTNLPTYLHTYLPTYLLSCNRNYQFIWRIFVNAKLKRGDCLLTSNMNWPCTICSASTFCHGKNWLLTSNVNWHWTIMH